MRFILAAAIGSVAITGMFGAYSTLSSTTSDSDFSIQYLQLASSNPDLLTMEIANNLPNCLSELARGLLDDSMVADLATKTLFKSGILIAEGKSAEQSAKEFIPWITEQAKPLNSLQKETYLKLIRGELLRPNVALCVISSVKAAIGEKIDLKAVAWDLRT